VLFPPSKFLWPSFDEDGIVTEEIDPKVIVVCPECDHEAVVDQSNANVLCGRCFEKGNHVDMTILGSD
jgi:hypothetical protein